MPKLKHSEKPKILEIAIDKSSSLAEGAQENEFDYSATASSLSQDQAKHSHNFNFLLGLFLLAMLGFILGGVLGTVENTSVLKNQNQNLAAENTQLKRQINDLSKERQANLDSLQTSQTLVKTGSNGSSSNKDTTKIQIFVTSDSQNGY